MQRKVSAAWDRAEESQSDSQHYKSIVLFSLSLIGDNFCCKQWLSPQTHVVVVPGTSSQVYRITQQPPRPPPPPIVGLVDGASNNSSTTRPRHPTTTTTTTTSDFSLYTVRHNERISQVITSFLCLRKTMNHDMRSVHPSICRSAGRPVILFNTIYNTAVSQLTYVHLNLYN